MRAVIQRVKAASVIVAEKKISAIGPGLLIFLGILKGDGEKDLDYLLNKTVGLRIFRDKNNNMNLSVKDVSGELLVVSQFTLCANTQRGSRPSFISAEDPIKAKIMYDKYCQGLKKLSVPIEMGKFGAMMNIELVNDGPVTIILDSRLGRNK